MNKAQSIDRAPVRGEFAMIVRDRSGNIVDRYEDHNMIVNGAKMVMAKLISEAASPSSDAEDAPTVGSQKMITTIAFGNGVAAVDATDTGMTGTDTVTKPLDGHEFPEGTEDRVQFNWSLGYGEANDLHITEFGLLCADETLFAHKVRNEIYKDDTLSFEGTWTIIF